MKRELDITMTKNLEISSDHIPVDGRLHYCCQSPGEVS